MLFIKAKSIEEAKFECAQKAVLLVNGRRAVFAYVSPGRILTSNKKGLRFLVRLCNEREVLSDGTVACKTAGKAEALLFVLLRVKSVFAETISENAAEVLEKHHIHYEFARMTPTSPCNYETESVVKRIDDPAEALKAINQALE